MDLKGILEPYRAMFYSSSMVVFYSFENNKKNFPFLLDR
jgi:hypothetical protein